MALITRTRLVTLSKATRAGRRTAISTRDEPPHDR